MGRQWHWIVLRAALTAPATASAQDMDDLQRRPWGAPEGAEILNANVGALSSCAPALETVNVYLWIGPSGGVRAVTARADNGARFECMEALIRIWRFPRSVSGTRGTFPIVLRRPR